MIQSIPMMIGRVLHSALCSLLAERYSLAIHAIGDHSWQNCALERSNRKSGHYRLRLAELAIAYARIRMPAMQAEDTFSIDWQRAIH